MKLLKFEAEWCSACKMLSKVMEDMTFPYPVEHIDADKNSAALIEYGVRGLPTMILLDENNNIVKKVIGYKNQDQLTKELELV